LKNYIYSLSFIFCLAVCSCASVKDLERAKGELGGRTDKLQREVAALDKKLGTVESQTELLAKTTKTLASREESFRVREADKGADITDLRDTLANLTGRIDVLQKNVSEIKGSVDKLNERMSFTEKYLDIGARKTAQALPAADSAITIDLPKNINADEAYEIAFNSFKEENFTKARNEFETYIVNYPDAQNVADAYYWIGECYYFEGNFDKAILQYDQVVKKYPKADKVPRALLKEGMCFSKLGDKITAKLLFGQVVQNYADTPEALTAQKKISELGKQEK
jgi:tol-pal system protein YbgF